MSFETHTSLTSERRFNVVPAYALRCTSGVNLGDPMSGADELCAGDGYTMRAQYTLEPLDLAPLPSHPSVFSVTNNTGPEVKGTRLKLSARVTLMSHKGARTDVLLVECHGPANRLYISPLGPLEPAQEYMILEIEDAPPAPPDGLLDGTGLNFARGTRITLGTGAQVAVEHLNVGEKVLTRQSGTQPIRYLTRHTVQAVGRFAPVVISPAAGLGNAESLIVAQSHRFLFTDWRAEVMTGSKDVLIEARDMVDGQSVFIREGGFVEYSQLAFEHHHLIYAEGVSCESLHVTPALLAQFKFNKGPAKFSAQTPARACLNRDQAREFLRQIGRI